jgi:Flp pilus assembly protein TadB
MSRKGFWGSIIAIAAIVIASAGMVQYSYSEGKKERIDQFKVVEQRANEVKEQTVRMEERQKAMKEDLKEVQDDVRDILIELRRMNTKENHE